MMFCVYSFDAKDIQIFYFSMSIQEFEVAASHVNGEKDQQMRKKICPRKYMPQLTHDFFILMP